MTKRGKFLDQVKKDVIQGRVARGYHVGRALHNTFSEVREKISVEDRMIEQIDEKGMLLDLMKDLSKTMKRVKGSRDPDSVMRVSSDIAAKVILKNMMFGDERTQIVAAKEILDRTLGKAVERTMNPGQEIANMSEREVKSEIIGILQELGRRGVNESHQRLTSGKGAGVVAGVEEGEADLEGERAGEVFPESGTGEVSRK